MYNVFCTVYGLLCLVGCYAESRVLCKVYCVQHIGYCVYCIAYSICGTVYSVL